MIIKILLSIILGFLIGLERETHGKAVGIRTISLITLGSTLFSIMSISIIPADASRIIAQIVTGVSFIGAGLIIKDNGSIRGLTTAAVVWVSASIGALVGIGMFKEAFIGTIAILIINLLFGYFKKNENRRIRKEIGN